MWDEADFFMLRVKPRWKLLKIGVKSLNVMRKSLNLGVKSLNPSPNSHNLDEKFPPFHKARCCELYKIIWTVVFMTYVKTYKTNRNNF